MVTGRQTVAVLGDGGVLVDQPPQNRLGAAALSLCLG